MLSNGPTWGMTGPEFLGLYLFLAVLAIIGAWRHRFEVSTRGPEPRLDRLHPYAVAYLAGGPHRAVAAAVAALRAAGVVEPQDEAGRTRLRPTGRPLIPPAGERPAWGTAGAEPSAAADDLDRVVLSLVQQGLPVHRAVDEPDGAAALERLRADLVQAGALLAPEQRVPARLAAVWPGLVAVLGAFRVSAGLANDRPVGFIVVGTVVMLGVTALVAGRTPDRHGRVLGSLQRLRTDAPHLEPSSVPSLATYGPAAAATAVALGGFAVLVSADPAMAQAEELTDLQRRMAATSGGDGSSGSSSGGDGGGDGGGGGCGGGCGGCGG